MKNDLLITHKKYKKWTDSFQHTHAIETKLIVGTRNNPNLTQEFVRHSHYLQKQMTKNTINKTTTNQLP
jgi:hypothetical protein